MIDAAIITPEAGAFARIKALVLDSLPSPESRRAYGRALDDFLQWRQRHGVRGFTKAAVNAYRAHLEGRGLAASTVNLRLSAVRKLALEAADNGLMPGDLAQGIARVKGVGRAGIRTGTWLTLGQAERLLAAPNPATAKGARDRALLAVLIGTGLRRREVAALTVEHVQLRDARWIIVDLIGKDGRVRTVPMPSWAKTAIDVWTTSAGIAAGLLFRSSTRAGASAGAA